MHLALQQAVEQQVQFGFVLEDWTANGAVMVHHAGKVNHVLHALLSLFTCGFWLIVWSCLVFFGRPSSRIRLDMDSYGKLHWTFLAPP